jgi:hypothetical protein
VSVSDIGELNLLGAGNGIPKGNGHDKGVDTPGTTSVDETSVAPPPTTSKPKQGKTTPVGMPAGRMKLDTSEKTLGRRDSRGECISLCCYIASQEIFFLLSIPMHWHDLISWFIYLMCQSRLLHSVETANQGFVE